RLGAGPPAPRLVKSPLEAGFTHAGREKANLPFPREFALLTPAYLAGTELIPPYRPGQPRDRIYKVSGSLFGAWAGIPCNSEKYGPADWLFDRATSHYKRYMDTGELKYLKEAFLAFRFYIEQIKQTGPIGKNCLTEGRGGWIGFEAGDKCKDMKY